MPDILDSELCNRLRTLPWTTLVDDEPILSEGAPDLRDRELVGGAAWLRGTWRGAVVVRCDRSLALAIGNRLPGRGSPGDAAVHWLLRRIADAVAEIVDATALATDTVTLAGSDVWWFPPSGVLKMRATIGLANAVIEVEVYERQRWQPAAAAHHS